jgi:NAD(P)-dependent dehydrogenase (short-subunit alcohol dehydrogenase family)
MGTALITGASAGLGLALAQALADRGWNLIIDARRAPRLESVTDDLRHVTHVSSIAGDVSLRGHREDLARAAHENGPLDLVVNNASTLGPSGLHRLLDTPLDELAEVMQVNALAPIAVLQAVSAELADGAVVVNISSDAAVENYEGWGGYGASKAALDHLTATLAAERPDLAWYAVDPGDMRTDMHQAAFPGEDISDRPEPADVVPKLLALLDLRPASGRYRAAEFVAETAVLSGEASA